MSTGTEAYHAQRACEHDRVYEKPERQADIDQPMITPLTYYWAATFKTLDA